MYATSSSPRPFSPQRFTSPIPPTPSHSRPVSPTHSKVQAEFQEWVVVEGNRPIPFVGLRGAPKVDSCNWSDDDVVDPNEGSARPLSTPEQMPKQAQPASVPLLPSLKTVASSDSAGYPGPTSTEASPVAPQPTRKERRKATQRATGAVNPPNVSGKVSLNRQQTGGHWH